MSSHLLPSDLGRGESDWTATSNRSLFVDPGAGWTSYSRPSLCAVTFPVVRVPFDSDSVIPQKKKKETHNGYKLPNFVTLRRRCWREKRSYTWRNSWRKEENKADEYQPRATGHIQRCIGYPGHGATRSIRRRRKKILWKVFHCVQYICFCG